VTEDSYPPVTPQKEDPVLKSKDTSASAPVRRPSVATARPVITPAPPVPPAVTAVNGPKPPIQTVRPPSELKYASAVAATTNPAVLLGLSPLPPPTAAPPIRQASVSSVGSSSAGRTVSPSIVTSVPQNVHVGEKPEIPKPTSPAQAPVQPVEGVEVPPEPTTEKPSTVNGDGVPSFNLNDTTSETDISLLPPGLRDLLHSFQSARSRAQSSSGQQNLSTTGKMLDTARLTAPESVDSESMKPYTPQAPYPTPSYYPQTPHATVTDPSFVRRCDVDTLFFMFYYQQETLQQYVVCGVWLM
jgi:CCR4-NOT transcription complex subunit 3